MSLSLGRNTMYKDIISYELAEGISEEHLLKVAEQVVDDWMKNQSGFINWEINSKFSAIENN